MIANLFILSNSGEVLIEKQWSGNIKRTACDVFLEKAGKIKKQTNVLPVISTPKYYFMHVTRYELTFLTVLNKETPPLFVIEILHHIINVLLDYFHKLSETSIRENFSTIYQLLDEMVDGGFPFMTDENQLKEMIPPPSFTGRVLQSFTGDGAVRGALPGGAMTKIPWRRSDVKYVTNEIYFDIVEQLDMIISANQKVISSTVYGDINCTCRLSGTPDLTLSFVRPSLLDDVSLHRCIRITRFVREKVISFVPPDGNFRLLSYKIDGPPHPPIRITPQINWRPGAGKFYVAVGNKSGPSKTSTFINVAIIIPLPSMVNNTSLTTNVGTIKLDEKTKILRWEIGNIPHDKSPTMEGNVFLPPDKVPDENPIIRAEWTCKMFCVSGLKVDGLAVRQVSYKPFKGVRSVTQAGKFFQVRTA